MESRTSSVFLYGRFQSYHRGTRQIDQRDTYTNSSTNQSIDRPWRESKNGKLNGRISRSMLVLFPTMQQVHLTFVPNFEILHAVVPAKCLTEEKVYREKYKRKTKSIYPMYARGG